MRPTTRAIIAAGLLLWLCAGRFCCAQVLDCTVSQELPEIGAKPFPGEYHLFNLGEAGTSIPRAVWQSAFDRVGRGEDVWLDIEPPHSNNPAWRQEIDPSKTTPAKLKATLAIIAKQLAPLCKLAERTGARVWVYGVFSPTYTRVEDIVNDPTEWREDVREQFAIGKELLAALHATGGGVLYEVYVPDGWNRSDGWAIAKCVLLLERQATLLEELGVRGLPLLNPTTIGGAAVQTETLRALVFAGKSRGRIAVWHGYHPTNKGTKPLTSEQKGLLK
jgi:hypothetical protein